MPGEARPCTGSRGPRGQVSIRGGESVLLRGRVDVVLMGGGGALRAHVARLREQLDQVEQQQLLHLLGDRIVRDSVRRRFIKRHRSVATSQHAPGREVSL